jgi:hypothetical protein
MAKQIISNIKNAELSRLDKIALRFFGVGFLVVVCSFCLLALVWFSPIGYILSMVWYSSTSVKIDASEIPIYPNAQNVIHEKPTENLLELATWKFTTNDSPEKVWKFYVDELSRRWGFFKSGDDTVYSRELVRAGCPAYLVDMTSSSTDNETYNITILFRYDPCR